MAAAVVDEVEAATDEVDAVAEAFVEEKRNISDQEVLQ